MNLAVASPSASAYSETFIQMQWERLPCKLRIHGGLRGIRRDGPQRRELKRRLKRAGIQRLLANYGPTGVALLPVCRELEIALVVHFHGYDAHNKRVVAEYLDSYRQVGREAAAIVAVSRRMVGALVEYGMPESKIKLTRYGVDPSRFPARSDIPATPLFFGVGRFVDKKAPYLTLLAFNQVHDRLPTARLVLAGDGLLWEATQNLTAALGLVDSVEFPGILKTADVASWMQKATAYVQHSITPAYGPSAGDSEGTPVAVLEAMMSALPVISTRHAGIGEVIEPGRTGLLVAERDVAGMADAMVELAENPEDARVMGQAARAEALEKYTSDHYIGSLRSIIQSIVDPSKGK